MFAICLDLLYSKKKEGGVVMSCVQQPVVVVPSPSPLFQIMSEEEKNAFALEDAVDSILSDWKAIQEQSQE